MLLILFVTTVLFYFANPKLDKLSTGEIILFYNNLKNQRKYIIIW